MEAMNAKVIKHIMSIAVDEVYNLLFASVTIGQSDWPQIGENWRDRSAI